MNYFAKSRIEALSDGVFAIIITLLVLEIKVPHIHQPNSISALSLALLTLLPKVASWVLSFLIVCVIWVNHHRMLNQIEHITHGLFWLNALLLLWSSFIPFPTALVGDYLTNPISAFVYGCIMTLMALMFTLMRWHALTHPAVLKHGVDLGQYRRETVRSLLFGPVFYLGGGVLAFWHTGLSLTVFAFIPLYFIFANSIPLQTGK